MCFRLVFSYPLILASPLCRINNQSLTNVVQILVVVFGSTLVRCWILKGNFSGITKIIRTDKNSWIQANFSILHHFPIKTDHCLLKLNFFVRLSTLYVPILSVGKIIWLIIISGHQLCYNWVVLCIWLENTSYMGKRHYIGTKFFCS